MAEIVFERIETLKDVDVMLEAGELDCFFNEPTWDKSKIVWKNATNGETKKHLEKICGILENKDAIIKYAEEAGKGNVLWPLRYALSGKEKSPDPFTLIHILGQEESEKRVKKVIEIL